MTTGEFIKMLQKEDPSGTAHLRMSGGVPVNVTLKEGYYDGPYSYIDEEKNYVTTSSGMKVDVYTEDVDDFVGDLINIHDNDNWEKIKSKFKFDFGCYAIPEQRQERVDRILREAKKAYDDYSFISFKSYEQSTDEMIINAKKGWTWFQNKDVEKNEKPNMHMYYTWKIYDENGRAMDSNVHQTECVLKSGEWEKLDNDIKKGYYQWIYKQ